MKYAPILALYITACSFSIASSSSENPQSIPWYRRLSALISGVQLQPKKVHNIQLQHLDEPVSTWTPRGDHHKAICKELELLEPHMPLELQKAICEYDFDPTLLNSKEGGALWRQKYMKINYKKLKHGNFSILPQVDTNRNVYHWVHIAEFHHNTRNVQVKEISLAQHKMGEDISIAVAYQDRSCLLPIVHRLYTLRSPRIVFDGGLTLFRLRWSRIPSDPEKVQKTVCADDFDKLKRPCDSHELVCYEPDQKTEHPDMVLASAAIFSKYPLAGFDVGRRNIQQETTKLIEYGPTYIRYYERQRMDPLSGKDITFSEFAQLHKTCLDKHKP